MVFDGRLALAAVAAAGWPAVVPAGRVALAAEGKPGVVCAGRVALAVEGRPGVDCAGRAGLAAEGRPVGLYGALGLAVVSLSWLGINEVSEGRLAIAGVGNSVASNGVVSAASSELGVGECSIDEALYKSSSEELSIIIGFPGLTRALRWRVRALSTPGDGVLARRFPLGRVLWGGGVTGLWLLWDGFFEAVWGSFGYTKAAVLISGLKFAAIGG